MGGPKLDMAKTSSELTSSAWLSLPTNNPPPSSSSSLDNSLDSSAEGSRGEEAEDADDKEGEAKARRMRRINCSRPRSRWTNNTGNNPSPVPPTLRLNSLKLNGFQHPRSQLGHLASTLQAGMPLPPTPTAFKRPEHLPWKPFGRAIDLAHRINVRPSIETLKTIELAEMEKERDAALQKDFEDIETAREESCDPRPRKRARGVKKPRGQAIGMMSAVRGKGKARDDDVVSLDFTE